MNVKLIRMWSGEDVVADLVEEKEDTIVLTNPIVAIPNGQAVWGLLPGLLCSRVEMSHWNSRKVILCTSLRYKRMLSNSMNKCSLSFKHLIIN